MEEQESPLPSSKERRVLSDPLCLWFSLIQEPEEQACFLAVVPKIPGPSRPAFTPLLTLAGDGVACVEKAAQGEVHCVGGLIGALAQNLGQLLQVSLDVLLQEVFWLYHPRLNDVY
jgi:hypothetical protein